MTLAMLSSTVQENFQLAARYDSSNLCL